MKIPAKWKKEWKRKWSQWKRDEKGGALVLFAAFLPILVAIAGLVIDTGVIAYHQAKLSEATDAAAWAGLDSYDRDLWNVEPPEELRVVLLPGNARSLAASYLAINYPRAELTGVEVSGATIVVKAQAECPFFFMKMFGIQGTTLHASAEARMEE
ncbi:TadE/TadG family type IV pilus assembly protein [Brevibacillus borstelensis]|uniref:TadE/TadG family type IV pilus assembly protein n=1 Tax=Brevibacillus borstelensis TaxID=45462 RepID=UPI0030BF2A48